MLANEDNESLVSWITGASLVAVFLAVTARAWAFFFLLMSLGEEAAFFFRWSAASAGGGAGGEMEGIRPRDALVPSFLDLTFSEATAAGGGSGIARLDPAFF